MNGFVATMSHLYLTAWMYLRIKTVRWNTCKSVAKNMPDSPIVRDAFSGRPSTLTRAGKAPRGRASLYPELQLEFLWMAQQPERMPGGCSTGSAALLPSSRAVGVSGGLRCLVVLLKDSLPVVLNVLKATDSVVCWHLKFDSAVKTA